MVDDLFFKKYKALKENFNVDYRGYQLKYIMAQEFIYFAYEMKTYKLTKSFIKSKLFYAQDLNDFKELLTQKKVLFSFDNYGNDHKNLLENIKNTVDESVLYEPKNKIKKHVDLMKIFVTFSQLFLTSKLKNISIQDRFYFFLLLVNYKNTLEELESNLPEINTTKFVPFLSCFPVDSILCQFFRKRGVISFGIQHGIHCSSIDYKTYIPYDVVNIENLQADYILAWGNFTKESLIKEGKSESQYLLAGSPKYLDVKDIVIKSLSFKRCVVCLARDIYFDGNLKLLEISKEMVQHGIKVYLKFHPRSDLKKYDPQLQSFDFSVLPVNSSIDDSIMLVKPDFVIVYNSTVYYEYYMKGIVAFRFGFLQNDIPFGLEDVFMDYSALKLLIETFATQSKDALDNEVNTMINRFCALGVNNYKYLLQ